jgi:hypothetical protein
VEREPVVVPNSVALHNIGHFLQLNDLFSAVPGQTETVFFHPTWAFLEPVALAMLSAWGGWCKRNDVKIDVGWTSRATEYAWRMKLFEHIGFDYLSTRERHEEAGRFLPVRQIKTSDEAKAAIGDLSALLHLAGDPQSLRAVQYCVSELVRNVLEHSSSPDGAFVCAQNYFASKTPRVSIAVADCGVGIRTHLGAVHQEASESDRAAVLLALRAGVTGAKPGMYGTPENAGAGLYFTRALAKGTGGYFLLGSGDAAYRLRRVKDPMKLPAIFMDPRSDRHDMYSLQYGWQGTVAAVELGTTRVRDFNAYIRWIAGQIPRRTRKKRVRFT